MALRNLDLETLWIDGWNELHDLMHDNESSPNPVSASTSYAVRLGSVITWSVKIRDWLDRGREDHFSPEPYHAGYSLGPRGLCDRSTW